MNARPVDAAPYLTLKLAHALFKKAPSALSDEERLRVADVAERQCTIEMRLLGTPEAAGVILREDAIAHALAEIRARFTSDAEYHADLALNGLVHETLREAIIRDLKVEVVLEKVGSRAAPVDDTEVEIFYLMHPERFTAPETRTLRHILLTINDEMANSDRASVWTRISDIRERLLRAPERFNEQALKHSECPTAMNGGLLGELPRGKLFPEIDQVAFALAEGELSAIVESPMGFHLLRCDAIKGGSGLIPLASVRERIRQHISDGRRRTAQKAWLAALLRTR
ncbi:nitrogen fixation protein NifM [Rhodocyclus tenuis]|uniref:nitrogen fixation protein NifM n=1 Tax=Rhodocyclus gracilis TaxID=2929842 RepID=UPI001298DEF8|nr:nitrogen fixation protein NifM [Rhodocyclus gracilis]MRD72415.1 nitrogen fixation protein NifM [Rhodocyclus gracilis]